MTWHYRLVQHEDGLDPTAVYFAVHEVYCDADGKPTSRTEDAVTVGGSTKEEVIAVLEMMLKDVRERPLYPMKSDA